MLNDKITLLSTWHSMYIEYISTSCIVHHLGQNYGLLYKGTLFKAIRWSLCSFLVFMFDGEIISDWRRCCRWCGWDPDECWQCPVWRTQHWILCKSFCPDLHISLNYVCLFLCIPFVLSKGTRFSPDWLSSVQFQINKSVKCKLLLLNGKFVFHCFHRNKTIKKGK